MGIGSGLDKLNWHCTPKGYYTVKSGYHLKVMNLTAVVLGVVSLQVSRRCGTYNCQTKSRYICGDYCSMLYRHQWKLTSIWPMLGGFNRGSFCDLFCHINECGKGDDLRLFALICWSIWVARNRMAFNSTKESPDDILARGIVWGQTIVLLHLIRKSKYPPPPSSSVWQDYFGIGNWKGRVYFAERRYLPGRFSPRLAKLVAVKIGVERVLSSRWTNWGVESDASNILIAIKNPTPFSMDEPIA